MKTLVADDDFVSRSLMQTILTDLGMADPDVVVSGLEAEQLIRKAVDQGEPYELVFLDMIMPSESGMEILHNIREIEKEHPEFWKNPSKVIMVTSVDNPGVVMDAFKENCDQYLVKPVNREKVHQALVKAGILEA